MGHLGLIPNKLCTNPNLLNIFNDLPIRECVDEMILKPHPKVMRFAMPDEIIVMYAITLFIVSIVGVLLVEKSPGLLVKIFSPFEIMFIKRYEYVQLRNHIWELTRHAYNFPHP